MWYAAGRGNFGPGIVAFNFSSADAFNPEGSPTCSSSPRWEMQKGMLTFLVQVGSWVRVLPLMSEFVTLSPQASPNPPLTLQNASYTTDAFGRKISTQNAVN
jgi:hypothetical protein